MFQLFIEGYDCDTMVKGDGKMQRIAGAQGQIRPCDEHLGGRVMAGFDRPDGALGIDKAVTQGWCALALVRRQLACPHLDCQCRAELRPGSPADRHAIG